MGDLNITPWAKEPPKHAISRYVTSINLQKGGFRDVTESSLEAEIARGSPSASEEEGDDEAGSAGAASSSDSKQREEVARARMELITAIAQALNETTYSHDLLSLLLTQDFPEQPAKTFSPHFQHLPAGTFGKERFQSTEPSAEEQVRDGLESTGLKLRSLNSSADALIAASGRLVQEMRHEAHYWEDVLQLKQQGWSVCRLPRDRRALGVRIGCLEASGRYREKSLVNLKRRDGGRAVLALESDVAAGRRLGIHVCHKGQTIASNSMVDSEAMDTDTLEDSVKQARDSLYDEELYYELSREVGSLWSFGVKWTDRGIVLSVDTDLEVVIFLSQADDGGSDIKDDPDLHEKYGHWPDALVTALRILLSHAHRQTYNKRSAPPQPITERKPQKPVHALLRPLLTLMQHQTVQRSVDSLLGGIKLYLDTAGLQISIESGGDKSGLQTLMQASSSTTEMPFVESLVEKLSNPPPSSCTIRLGSSTTTIRALFRITPTGTEYRYEIKDPVAESLLSGVPQNTTFQSQGEFESFVLHLIQLHLVDVIKEQLQPGKWESDSPHSGELRPSSSDMSVRLIQIRLLHKGLVVSLTSLDEHDQQTTRNITVGRKTPTMSPPLLDQLRDICGEKGAST